MRKLFLSVLIFPCICLWAFASELPQEVKKILISKFPGINFKIDHSFTLKDNVFLPLIPKTAKKDVKKIELLDVIPDDKNPKLLLFSNDWIYVRVLKNPDGTQAVIDLKDIPVKYKELFLMSQFPEDLVVPKGLTVKKELTELVGDLPISIEEQNTEKINSSEIKNLSGVLYLTSPDNGEIIYIDLSNPSKINHIQTDGTPWSITYDSINEVFFITDFAKDYIYEIKPMQQVISKKISLPSMSGPKDIELSDDSSTIYVVESIGNNFATYSIHDDKYSIKTKLPINSTNLSVLQNTNFIAVSSPSENKIVLLNKNDYSSLEQIMIEGGPENLISSRDGMTVFTVNRNANSISVIDVESKKIKDTFQTEETPVSIAIDSNEKFLYIGNGKSNSISIIDLTLKKTIGTIKLPAETQFPGDIKITDDGKWLIATSETTNKISIIDLLKNEIALKLDVGATTHSAYLINKGFKIETKQP